MQQEFEEDNDEALENFDEDDDDDETYNANNRRLIRRKGHHNSTPRKGSRVFGNGGKSMESPDGQDDMESAEEQEM